MAEYERVTVTASPGPQQQLAREFPAENYHLDEETDSVTLIANPTDVQEYIEQVDWNVWVYDVESEPIADLSTLPDALRVLVTEGQPRVCRYARQLVPDDDSVEDYIWHGRISFSWNEGGVGQRTVEPPTVELLNQWVEDEYFNFNRGSANPSQDADFGGGDGPVFQWADALAEDHPEAELRVRGDLRPSRTGAPHGYAYLDGLAITMCDGSEMSDEVVEWFERRFWAEYDVESDSYLGGEEYIGQADEFTVYDGTEDRSQRPWLRIWWD